mmetsp:Transcript_30814/g.74015  ORF Transcript_30814/g.74015 Transcript_30814/m.74015 type:complete len:208 (-) Transcript_30814:18-641(-)
MAAFIEESDAFDGAMREKATAPKIPPRRRRAPQQPTSDDDAPAEEAPAVKKNAGWGMDGDGDGAKPSQGRRAAGGAESTAITTGINDDGPSKSEPVDDDIMVIPDLEENDEEEMILAVAEPGQVQNASLPTNLKLDDGTLPPSQVEGIDLSLLFEAILPQKQLIEDDDDWDPDTMLNQLKQAMQDEEDKRVEGAETDSAAKDKLGQP